MKHLLRYFELIALLVAILNGVTLIMLLERPKHNCCVEKCRSIIVIAIIVPHLSVSQFLGLLGICLVVPPPDTRAKGPASLNKSSNCWVENKLG